MKKFFEKYWFHLYALLLLNLLVSLYLWPSVSHPLSLMIMILGISLALFFNTRKHWLSYQQAECTREKMMRNLSFDIIGLLLTMGAAMYVGRLAGEYIGFRAGFWIGLLAGFMGGFVAAWAVRSVWGKLVSLA